MLIKWKNRIQNEISFLPWCLTFTPRRCKTASKLNLKFLSTLPVGGLTEIILVK